MTALENLARMTNDSDTDIAYFVEQLNQKQQLETEITELSETNTTLRKIINLLGKEEKQKANHIQIFIFEDGTIEKRIVIE